MAKKSISFDFVPARRISGPHICGDALDIDPNTHDILTGSWSYSDTLQVCGLLGGREGGRTAVCFVCWCACKCVVDVFIISLSGVGLCQWQAIEHLPTYTAMQGWDILCNVLWSS